VLVPLSIEPRRELFVEARYLTVKAFDVTYAQLPVTVGVSFPRVKKVSSTAQ